LIHQLPDPADNPSADPRCPGLARRDKDEKRVHYKLTYNTQPATSAKSLDQLRRLQGLGSAQKGLPTAAPQALIQPFRTRR
jgi:hypothetical protein